MGRTRTSLPEGLGTSPAVKPAGGFSSAPAEVGLLAALAFLGAEFSREEVCACVLPGWKRQALTRPAKRSPRIEDRRSRIGKGAPPLSSILDPRSSDLQ